MGEPAATAWRALPECTRQQHDDPFPYGWVDDYLPVTELADLAAGFPDLDRDPDAQRLPRGKRRLVLRSADADRPGLSAPWAQAVQAVSSAAYLDRTLAFVRSTWRASAPGQAPDEVADARERIVVGDLDVQIEAAELADGAFLPPHTDAADKLVSCVLALPTTDPWPAAWGGQTQILRARRPRPNWSNALGDPAQFDLVADVPVQLNRLFWFVKTSYSWHAVQATTPVPPQSRRSFNVSIVVSARGVARTGLDTALAAVAAAERGQQ